jgi:hypothetical protein
MASVHRRAVVEQERLYEDVKSIWEEEKSTDQMDFYDLLPRNDT